MKVSKFYQVSAVQLFLMAILTGVISGGLVISGITLKEQLQTPVVVISKDECVNVLNYKNGDAYTCADVDVILRSYRKKIE